MSYESNSSDTFMIKRSLQQSRIKQTESQLFDLKRGRLGCGTALLLLLSFGTSSATSCGPASRRRSEAPPAAGKRENLREAVYIDGVYH